MANFNKVLLIGNLTRDPELRYTQDGRALVKFGLAVNRRYKGKTQEMVEETTFVDIEGWGPQAETFNRYMKKGRPVFVEGRLRLDSWEGKDGQKRNRLLVVMEGFQFLGQGGGGARAGEGTRPAKTPAQADEVAEAPPATGGGEDYNFEDIPF
jgi:single-strand DNA-binding protein